MLLNGQLPSKGKGDKTHKKIKRFFSEHRYMSTFLKSSDKKL